jgi:UDP-glucose 4-epimerase
VTTTVLVVGAARHLGARLAKTLADDPRVDRVIGVDAFEPPVHIGDAEFVEVDIRTSDIAQAIKHSRADTVVHMNVLATQADAGGRIPQKEINVIGTMQLLAACQRSETVAKLIVKSSAAVYGAHANAPALFTEDMLSTGSPRRGYEKDASEVEGYVRGFTRRRPDIDVTILRTANVVGPAIRTQLTEYFTLPVIPVVPGRDPRFQLLHEDDCLDALRLAVLEERAGIYNVAGDGFLVMSQALARTGRPGVPTLGLGNSLVNGALKAAGAMTMDSTQAAFLTFGRGIDTTRMRTQLHFEPSYSTSEAFDSYLAAHKRGPFTPERIRKAANGIARAIGGEAKDA